MFFIIIRSFTVIALSTCVVEHFLRYACWNVAKIIAFYLNYLALSRFDDLH